MSERPQCTLTHRLHASLSSASRLRHRLCPGRPADIESHLANAESCPLLTVRACRLLAHDAYAWRKHCDACTPRTLQPANSKCTLCTITSTVIARPHHNTPSHTQPTHPHPYTVTLNQPSYVTCIACTALYIISATHTMYLYCLRDGTDNRHHHLLIWAPATTQRIASHTAPRRPAPCAIVPVPASRTPLITPWARASYLSRVIYSVYNDNIYDSLTIDKVTSIGVTIFIHWRYNI